MPCPLLFRAVCRAGLLAALALSGPAWAQAPHLTDPAPAGPPTTLVMPPPPLLPADPRLLDPAQAAPATDDPAQHDALAEDGLAAEAARSVQGGGAVHAYRFNDATGAYAAFTLLADGGRPAETGFGSEATAPHGERVLLAGTSVLRATAGTPRELVTRIVEGLPKVGGRMALKPLLPTYLPAAELDRASVRYALGPRTYQAAGGTLPVDSMGWTKSLESVQAAYGRRGTLTLLLYPTPEIAGDRGRAIAKAITDAGSAHFGTVRMRRIGPLVGVTTGDFSPARAEALIASLRLDQVVTFDQKKPPEFHTEIRKTASLLENIAVLSGILVVAAVLLGLFLGGARAGIRKLQGKPAASEPEFLSINLRSEPNPGTGGASASKPGQAGDIPSEPR